MTFYKDEQQRWYADIPEWEGDKAELEMVEGADVFLDKISGYTGRVTLFIELNPFPGSQTLTKMNDLAKIGYDEKSMDGFGAFYSINEIDYLWLCPVLEWYFGSYPDKIFYKKTFTE